MYKNCIVIFAFIMMNSAAFSQNQDKGSIEGKEFSKEQSEQTSNKSTSISLIDSTNIFVKRINNIDDHIKAIDTKVGYINNDQSKKEKAEKEGWFNDMRKIKEELLMERTLLKSKLAQIQIK